MDKMLYDEKAAKISDAVFDIPFKKSKEDLTELSEYVKFVKGAENLAKKHPDYDLIIKTVRETQPHCQVLGNLTVDDVEIEVHHNCLTHFDICAIITNALLKRGEKVTTFEIARLDLLEHKLGHVQLVCLSKSVHQAVDTGELFVNLNQGIGNLRAFIEKYKDGIDDIYKEKLNKYIKMSKEFKSTDSGIFDLAEELENWSYDD